MEAAAAAAAALEAARATAVTVARRLEEVSQTLCQRATKSPFAFLHRIFFKMKVQVKR